LRSLDPAEIRAGLARARVIPEPQDAREEALRGRRAMVITGSFYLAGARRPRVRELAAERRSEVEVKVAN
jgi:hypothetical protein